MITSGQLGVTANDITYSWVPYLVVGLSAYAIATAFLMVLEVGIDAILVAYCEAMSTAVGENGTPLHAFEEKHIPLELKEHFAKFGTENQFRELSDVGKKGTVDEP